MVNDPSLLVLFWLWFNFYLLLIFYVLWNRENYDVNLWKEKLKFTWKQLFSPVFTSTASLLWIHELIYSLIADLMNSAVGLHFSFFYFFLIFSLCSALQLLFLFFSLLFRSPSSSFTRREFNIGSIFLDWKFLVGEGKKCISHLSYLLYMILKEKVGCLLKGA